MLATLSEVIEEFIKQMIDDTNGTIEIQRNELASYFRCVPSQINYVISTRFTTDKGYYVESRRGGGGHIRIKRANIDKPKNYLMHIISAMGDNITQQSAEVFINNFLDYGVITKREAAVMLAAISNKILVTMKIPDRDKYRANILKNMLIGLLTVDGEENDIR